MDSQNQELSDDGFMGACCQAAGNGDFAQSIQSSGSSLSLVWTRIDETRFWEFSHDMQGDGMQKPGFRATSAGYERSSGFKSKCFPSVLPEFAGGQSCLLSRDKMSMTHSATTRALWPFEFSRQP